VTEVTSGALVPMVAEYADIIQVGTRNMQNYWLLDELGKLRQPILLKRGMMNTATELLMSAEYILSAGNYQVILCERGIRSFGDETRNTFDVNAIAWLKHASHLPILADPSHATANGGWSAGVEGGGGGRRGWVANRGPSATERGFVRRQAVPLAGEVRALDGGVAADRRRRRADDVAAGPQPAS